MQRNLIRLLLLLLILSTLCSCITTPQIIYKDVDYKTEMVIKKDTLNKMMDEMIWEKLQLLNCLERERTKQ